MFENLHSATHDPKYQQSRRSPLKINGAEILSAESGNLEMTFWKSCKSASHLRSTVTKEPARDQRCGTIGVERHFINHEKTFWKVTNPHFAIPILPQINDQENTRRISTVGNCWLGNHGVEIWSRGGNLCVRSMVRRKLEMGPMDQIKYVRWSCRKKMYIAEAPKNYKQG